MIDWLLLTAGLILSIGTGFFVAAEFSLVNLDRADLEARQARGERGLGPVITTLKRASTHLSSAQLGITLTTLLTGYTMEPAITRLLAPALETLGIHGDATRTVGAAAGVVVATIVSMVVGELVPKNLALALPEFTAKLVSPFQLAFTTVFGPAVHVLNGLANTLLRAMGIEPKEELSSARTAQELSSLVKHSALEGSLDVHTAILLGNTLNFSEYTASEVMTPRTQIEALSSMDSAQTVITRSYETGFSRYPIMGEDIDDIVGFIHVKTALAVPRDQRATTLVRDLKSEVLLVPGSMTLEVLLGQLRQRSLQIAVVLDEYGGTEGIVTLEDLVEELVGAVVDEHDDPEREARRTLSGGWILSGMLRADEVEDRLGITFAENDDYDTVGGYVMAELEKLPEVGDEAPLGTGMLAVIRLDGHRIDLLRYTPGPEDERE